MKALLKMFRPDETPISEVKASHDPAMDKIRMLYNAIDFGELKKRTGKIRELETEEGSIFVVDLFCSDIVGIVRSSATAGTKLSRHSHGAFEALVLYEGVMDLIFDGYTVQLNIERPTYYIEPDVPHAAFFIENTKAIGITIPNAYRG